MNIAEGLTGQIIDGKLEVKELIGEGGMGAVYRVRHWEWNVDLALKSPHPELLSSEVDRERWIQEAHTWVDLGLHPNIVPCWFVREWRGIPVLFLDYLPGGSLKDLMERGELQRDDWGRILKLMIQACDGLGYAHRRDLIHRDVKPANMLIDSRGNLCVTDFGLAKVAQQRGTSQAPTGLVDMNLGRRADLSLTATGTLMGTPHYAAPEQWMNGEVGVLADIYALGILFFELACGRHPFFAPGEEAGLGELVTGHLQTPPPDPKSLNPNVPALFSQLILDCLAKEASARPADTAAVRSRLEEAYREATGSVYSQTAPGAATERADALNNKAVSLWSLGEKQEAFAAWREASALDSLHPETNYNRSVAHWSMGRLSPEEVERRLHQIKTTHRRAGAYLGYFLLARNEPDEAATELEKIIADTSLADDGPAWKALGDTYMSLGGFAQAQEAYGRALERIPEDRESQMRLEMAREEKRRDPDGNLVFPLARPISEFNHFGAEQMVASSQAVLVAGNGRLEKFDIETGRSLWGVALEGKLGRFVLQDGLVYHLDSTEPYILSWETGHLVGSVSRGTRLFALVPGQRALAGDIELKLIRRPGGERLKVLLGHDKQVTAVGVSQDGQWALSGSCDRTARLWNLETCQCVSILRGHKDFVEAVALKKAGDLALTGGRDRALRLWMLPAGDCIGHYPDHPGNIEQIHFSEEENLAIVACRDDTRHHVVVWDLSSRAQLLCREGRLLTLAPGRIWLARDGQVDQWVLPAGVNQRVFEAGEGRVLSSAFCDWLAIAYSDSKVRLWELAPEGFRPPPMIVTRSSSFREAEAARETFTKHFEEAVRARAKQNYPRAYEELKAARAVPGYEQDPKALGLQGELLKELPRIEISLITERRRFEEPGQTSIRAVTISGDGGTALTVAGKSIRVWNTSTGSCLRGLNGHKGGVRDVALSDDGRVAISGGEDRSFRVWEPATGRCLKVFIESQDVVDRVALTPDARWAAAADRGGRTRVYDLSQVTCRWLLKTSGLLGLSFCRDGSLLLTQGKDQNLVWDVTEGKALEVRHSPQGREGTLFQQGRFVVSIDEDELLVWDYEEEGQLFRLEGHSDLVNGLCLSRDGLTLATFGLDRTIRLWDLLGKRCLRNMGVFAVDLTSLALTPDARVLVAADSQGGLRVWELDWELDPRGRKQGLEQAYPPPGPLKRFLRRFARR